MTHLSNRIPNTPTRPHLLILPLLLWTIFVQTNTLPWVQSVLGGSRLLCSSIFILKKNINFINSSQIIHLNTYHETSIILVSRTLISFHILVDQGQILNLNTFHRASLILVYQTVISFHILVDHGLRQR